MSRASLDWNDAAAVTRWLGALEVSLSDAHAVSEDMLLPARERELGPVLHAQKYGDARAQIVQLLAYARPPAADAGEPGDPAGNGGGGPVD
jgi:hypothetical protein